MAVHGSHLGVALDYSANDMYGHFLWFYMYISRVWVRGAKTQKVCVFMYVETNLCMYKERENEMARKVRVLFYRDGDQGLNPALHGTSWKLRYIFLILQDGRAVSRLGWRGWWSTTGQSRKQPSKRGQKIPPTQSSRHGRHQHPLPLHLQRGELHPKICPPHHRVGISFSKMQLTISGVIIYCG